MWHVPTRSVPSSTDHNKHLLKPPYLHERTDDTGAMTFPPSPMSSALSQVKNPARLPSIPPQTAAENLLFKEISAAHLHNPRVSYVCVCLCDHNLSVLLAGQDGFAQMSQQMNHVYFSPPRETDDDLHSRQSDTDSMFLRAYKRSRDMLSHEVTETPEKMRKSQTRSPANVPLSFNFCIFQHQLSKYCFLLQHGSKIRSQSETLAKEVG